VRDENLLAGMKMFRETLTFCKTSRKILDIYVSAALLDFLIRTYVQKLHTIAKQAFSNWRNLNSPHGRFASEVSKTKHQLDYS
jgi:hypothetical protein